LRVAYKTTLVAAGVLAAYDTGPDLIGRASPTHL